VERRLAAVLAADVAGYSRLMGADEEGTLSRLKAIRKSLVDPAIAAHHGRIVKTTGDGMLVEFASVVDAARCAVEVQREMVGHSAGVAQDLRLEFRIGIHVGDIIIDDNDIFGDGVNIAARLEGIGEAGGVCISDDAQRQIRGKVDIALDDMGPQVLKNIAEPMRAWRVRIDQASAAPAIAKASAGSAPPLALPDKPSIAVLPFQNMSGDPEREYFADGMVEDIITALSRFKSLFVIARNSSFMYKGRATFDSKNASLVPKEGGDNSCRTTVAIRCVPRVDFGTDACSFCLMQEQMRELVASQVQSKLCACGNSEDFDSANPNDCYRQPSAGSNEPTLPHRNCARPELPRHRGKAIPSHQQRRSGARYLARDHQPHR
jgi:class 3 adenylate cyclase